MDDKKNNERKIESNERQIMPGERDFSWKEKDPSRESKEISPDEKIVREEIMREIDMMELDDNLKAEAEEKVKKIHFLADDDKLKNLLQVAREKGVIFAIKVAKSMNDPFLLDTLHDILSKEGYYKNFVK